MTDILSDIGDRITAIRQLGSVVNAMTGIAAARARTAQAQVKAVEHYSAIIGRAMAQAVAGADAAPAKPSREILVVFSAEQGFAGGFSERVLGRLAGDLAGRKIFLIGSRGTEVARSRGIEPHWSGALPSHSAGIPKFANELAEAVLSHAAGDPEGRFAVEAIFTMWREGSLVVERRRLLPVEPAAGQAPLSTSPLTNLPLQELLPEFEADYFHAQLCKAALNSFAAENEARMATMSAARLQIERELVTLEATQRRVRQEAITTEIIEIAAGDTASRSRQPEH